MVARNETRDTERVARRSASRVPSFNATAPLNPDGLSGAGVTGQLETIASARLDGSTTERRPGNRVPWSSWHCYWDH